MAKYEVEFPEYFTGPGEAEYEAKGYLPDVFVKLSDGRRYRLFFFDSVRASQQTKASGMVVEPNLIVVQNIDRHNILSAIEEAANQAYFEEIGEEKTSQNTNK